MSASSNAGSAESYARRARSNANDDATRDLAYAVEYLAKAIKDLSSEVDDVARMID